MFGFFKNFKNDVTKAFDLIHNRLVVLENKVDTLFGDKIDNQENNNAQQDTQAEEVHGGGSAQPAVREEGGDQAVGSEGVQSGGHGEAVETPAVEGQ